jgi:hypothetical protein
MANINIIRGEKEMSNKHKNSKKKMASLGLRKDENGDYKYIDPNDTTSEFVPVRNNKSKSTKD